MKPTRRNFMKKFFTLIFFIINRIESFHHNIEELLLKDLFCLEFWCNYDSNWMEYSSQFNEFQSFPAIDYVFKHLYFDDSNENCIIGKRKVFVGDDIVVIRCDKIHFDSFVEKTKELAPHIYNYIYLYWDDKEFNKMYDKLEDYRDYF